MNNLKPGFKTIQDFLVQDQITLELIDERACEEESPYWAAAWLFVKQNYRENLFSLSEKQLNWLDKIRDDMVEWRIENK